MAALLQPKRRRHALATSFAILDARSYGEIANVQVCARLRRCARVAALRGVLRCWQRCCVRACRFLIALRGWWPVCTTLAATKTPTHPHTLMHTPMHTGGARAA
jgi:hypothetical protein